MEEGAMQAPADEPALDELIQQVFALKARLVASLCT
jgi:hypothetical protein